MAQLPLALRFDRHASFDSYVIGGNLAAVEHVRAVALGDRDESVWLFGPDNTGKSHLLGAACRSATEAGRRPMYLALDPALEPRLLADLDGIDLLALDDVERVAGLEDWEAALFAVIDARLTRGGLLLAAGPAPRDTGFDLPDLVSRASAAAVYRLAALDDSDLLTAVCRQAAQRGLELDAATARYLVQRVSRDLGRLIGWIDRIDRFALATQRRITIPLVRRVIEEQGAG